MLRVAFDVPWNEIHVIPEDEGQYDRIGRRNPFEGGGASDSSLSVEYSNTNSEINREERTSTDTVTYNKKKAPREKYRKQHRRRDVAAGGSASAILTAAALKQHEKRYSSPSRDTDLILPKEEHRRKQVKDHIQDSEDDAALLSLDTVHNAIRKLIRPDVETMKQEPTTKRNELSYQNLIALEKEHLRLLRG